MTGNGQVATSKRERSHRWADPSTSASAARERGGLDFLQAIASGELPPAPVSETLGFTLREVESGRAVFEIVPAEFHYNPIGTVHGGVYATLLDSAAGCALHSLLPDGVGYTSLDLTVRFLRPVTTDTGPLTCEGTVIHLGGRTALAEARLCGDDGRLYAHATSTLMVFRPERAAGNAT